MKTTPLEERTGKEIYDEVMAYLKKQAEKAILEKLPIPHPLDFSLSTQEEEYQKRVEIDRHNSACNAKASTYEDVAYVMEYSYVRKVQQEADIEDLSRFGQGI